MTSSCATSNVSDNTPFVKIPDLPRNVYAKETALPKVPNEATLEQRTKIAKKLFIEYRRNERHNVRAINSARQHNSNLQDIYKGPTP